MQHFIAMATAHPGRMSPNTALCFMLLGTIVVVLRTSGHGAPALLLTGLGRCRGHSAGVGIRFGYLVQVKGVPGQAYFTDMAVHAAVGCILLGPASLSACGAREVHPTWAPRWGIALVGLSLATATLCLWQALRLRNGRTFFGHRASRPRACSARLWRAWSRVSCRWYGWPGGRGVASLRRRRGVGCRTIREPVPQFAGDDLGGSIVARTLGRAVDGQ